jgi:hypothetical protein
MLTLEPPMDTNSHESLTEEHMEIMRHTRDRAAGGFFCGDSPQMRELVAKGLMVSAGWKSFVPDEYFRLTEKGRETLRAPQHSCPFVSIGG